MICSSVSYVRLFERTVEITGNPKDSAHWYRAFIAGGAQPR